jgi:hypothetical protein
MDDGNTQKLLLITLDFSVGQTITSIKAKISKAAIFFNALRLSPI